MQSFRQYRELGQSVAAQYDSKRRQGNTSLHPLPCAGVQHSSDRESTVTESSSSSSSSSTSSPTVLPSPGDPEKGEAGVSQNVGQTLEGHGKEYGEKSEATREDEVQGEETEPDVSRAPTTGTNFGRALTGINVRKATTLEGGGDRQVFVVGFHGDRDPLNPHNWSYARRIWAV